MEEEIKNKSVKEWMLSLLGIKRLFRQLPFVFFLAVLGLIYIFNVHKAEKLMREIQQLEKENKELRWQYVNAKSQLMFNSTQSKTLKRVKEKGLGYEGEHPIRIKKSN